MNPTPFDVERCRRDFPSLSRAVDDLPVAFLDGPAGTQVPRQVIDAISRYYERSNANTHGAFATSRETDEMMCAAREGIATFVGSEDASTISLGQNMTTLAYSLARAIARTIEPGDEIVITQLDHEANREPWIALGQHGAVIREVTMDANGQLDWEDFERKVGPRTRLVAVGAASNALGTVNDLGRVRELTRDKNAWLAVDAVHYAPHFPIDVAAIDPDFLFCSAYKFYGPHVGILYSRPGLLDELEPERLRTQQQSAPERIETGTLNHAAIAGTLAAIEYRGSWGEGDDLRDRLASAALTIAEHERALATHYWERLAEISGVKRWGPGFSERRSPTIAITIDGHQPAAIARFLAGRGINVWEGHFYALRPIEILGLAESGGVVRVGVSMYNTRDEIGRLLDALEDLVR
jgi:cysteine desulfurase family protein (TIGR01976 family)